MNVRSILSAVVWMPIAQTCQDHITALAFMVLLEMDTIVRVSLPYLCAIFTKFVKIMTSVEIIPTTAVLMHNVPIQ